MRVSSQVQSVVLNDHRPGGRIRGFVFYMHLAQLINNPRIKICETSNREVFMYFDVSPLLTYLVPQNVSTNPNTPCHLSLSSISCDAFLHGIGSKIPSSSCHSSIGIHGRTSAKASANYLSSLILEEHKFQVIFWIKLYGLEW